MTTRVPALVVAAFLLLGTAWLVGNPPGASPDEPAHYLKAVAAGRGDLHLARKPPAPRHAESLTPAERWHQRTDRLVQVPPGLAPTLLACNAFHPEISAGCLNEPPVPGPTEVGTVVGPYQPFTYVLPGLLMRPASDPESATRLGRLGFWLVSAGLLASAAYLLWSPAAGGSSLIGLLVATTPMVLFMASSLSANGLEIAGGVCFGAALIRLARDGPQSGWTWAAAGVSGIAMALSRVTGVAWVILSIVAVAALVGRRPAGAIVRRAGRRALWVGAGVAVAMVASLAWEVMVQPRPPRSVGAAVRGLPRELRELPDVYEQAVGRFGWLDAPLPREAYWAWTVLLVALVLLALFVGRPRQRIVVGGLVAGSVVVTLAVATLNRPTGFPVQARYVLAFLVMVPLVAGEVLCTNRARLPARAGRFVVPSFAGFAAAVQAVAWYANGRRYAVGTNGPRWFLGAADWSPPLGWVPWLAVTLLAAASMAAAGLVALRTPPGSAGEPTPGSAGEPTPGSAG